MGTYSSKIRKNRRQYIYATNKWVYLIVKNAFNKIKHILIKEIYLVPQNNVLCRKHNKLACISLRISLQSSRLASLIVNPIIIKQADLPSLNNFN